MIKKIKCNVCGCKFTSDESMHYIARDNQETGLAASFGSKMEPALFDAFDCPECNCQVIVGKRKRELYSYTCTEELKECEEESMENEL